jgi:hypothetical protein
MALTSSAYGTTLQSIRLTDRPPAACNPDLVIATILNDYDLLKAGLIYDSRTVGYS